MVQLAAGAGATLDSLRADAKSSADGAADAAPPPSVPTDIESLQRLGEGLTESLLDNYGQVSHQYYDLCHLANLKAGITSAESTVLDSIVNIARLASMGERYAMEWDPAYPMIVKLLSMDRGIPGQPNADSDYQIAPMHGDYSYRLFSNRGSARVLNVTVYHGTMSQMERPFFSSLSSQGIEIPGGEEVEIALSKEKRRGRWLPMPDGLCFLYIRQYYRDWDTEEPARLVIEREGAVYPPPKSDMSAVAERVKMMNDWMHTISNVAIRDASEILNGEPNTLKAHVFPTGANHEVDYYSAYSLCKPDEAVVIEFKPPNVRYWGVTLCGVDGGALQPHTRQVSINGHQAAVDADGKVRIVVSHVDPGVRNWLDTSGHDLALIACRILSPAATPTFGMKVVPLGQLRANLPKEVALVSPSERQEMLRRRLISSYRRMMVDA
jgi:hypothetical protein